MSVDQIAYICVAWPVTALLVFIGTRFKSSRGKNVYLIAIALICFFLHISTQFTTFLDNVVKNDSWRGVAYDNQLLPIYFCNFVMYLLLIGSVWHNKQSRFFQAYATFTAWGGIFGAIITEFVTNPSFLPFIDNPSFGVWASFQSALSHSFLMIGCLLMIAYGYVKIRVWNVVPYALGILGCGVVGVAVNTFLYIGGVSLEQIRNRNVMYLYHGPAEAPEMHGALFGVAMLAIIFVVAMIWEFIAKRKHPEDMWYRSIKDLDMYFPLEKFKRKPKAVACECGCCCNEENLEQVENDANCECEEAHEEAHEECTCHCHEDKHQE